jgi:hypothetical protein
MISFEVRVLPVVLGMSAAISRNLLGGEQPRVSGNPLRSIPETTPLFDKIYLYSLTSKYK